MKEMGIFLNEKITEYTQKVECAEGLLFETKHILHMYVLLKKFNSKMDKCVEQGSPKE